MTADTYNSRTAEFRADLADIISRYKAEGLGAASDRCSVIVEERGLNAGQRLTLADGFRRAVILGLGV